MPAVRWSGPLTPEEHIRALLTEFGPLPTSKLLRIFSRRARRGVMHTLDGMLRNGRVGLDEQRRLVPVRDDRVGRR
jgi:hypothetical protein